MAEEKSGGKLTTSANKPWHDGTPVTPDDVIFSFEAFKKYSPQLSAYYRHVMKAEKTSDREVTFTADAPGNRELPLIIGALTVLPKTCRALAHSAAVPKWTLAKIVGWR